MRDNILTCLLAGAAALALAAPAAEAGTVKLGTATGGLMIHYNNLDVNGAGGPGVPDGVVSGYDEAPNNQAYTRAQNAYGNPNGMTFSFDGPGLQAIFGQIAPSQFGFDLQAIAPTYNPAGGVVPPGNAFADYLGGGLATYTPAVGPVSWGINDYKWNAGGPADPGNLVLNSVFRGTGLQGVTTSLSVLGTVYTLDISGYLVSDGLIHWYTPGTPDTALASLGFGSSLLFSGRLSYDRAGDTGADQRDFYQGSIDIFLVPEPATLALLGLGVAGVSRQRRRLRPA